MSRLSRKSLIAAACAAGAAQLFGTQSALADGGDFSLDFVAAAPLTYDHATGGGNYNQRLVGRDKDIVESLEGGDFSCGDTVTFLTQIRVNVGAVGTQTIRLNYQFTAYSTGQQGVALLDNVNGTSAAINVSDPGSVQTGIPATATVVPGSEILDGVPFVKPTTFYRSVEVSGLEAGDKVVLRTDTSIGCNGQTPTGNMQARLASAQVIAPASDAISAGDQTIPFKHVGDIKNPPPPPPK
ncbi:MAG TPA: hypothetical protein VFU71_17140 [Burkholderiaceae bacterium]|nr:hypothetical protein [Burkholderiaceae bacterium]